MSGDSIDPFTIEICRSRLDSIVQEMATALIKTSSSPTTTETKDFSCSLFDYRGRQLALSSYVLYHAASNAEGIAAILREYPRQEIEDGDVFIANDPCFGGGIHPGDVCIFRPHFLNGAIVAWSACTSHQIDVGGAVPGGWNANATECYAEAILLPPVKIMRRGTIDRGMWMLLMNNVRMSERVGLDFKGLIAANSVAGNRIIALAETYGYQAFTDIQERILDLSEIGMRRRIQELADGVYRAVDWLENDGHGDGLWKVACELRVSGDEMVFDYNGSDPQTQGFVNCGPSGLAGGPLTHILQMFGHDIPYNDGFLRPLRFVADKGKLVNAVKPAPIGAGHMNATCKIEETAQACISKMLAASGDPWRHRAMGAWADSWVLHLCHGTNREGKFDIYINMDGGGCGGGAYSDRDGIPVGGTPPQCGMDLPDVEFNEMSFPLFFQFKRLRTNSGGAGKYRGGLALEYAWSIYGVPEMNTVLHMQRYRVPQIGMFGADLVSTSLFELSRNSDVQERLAARAPHPISHDAIPGERIIKPMNDQETVLTDRDVFYVANCGGGGFGDPLLRDPLHVARDVADDFVDTEMARLVWGVILTEDGEVDVAATARCRSAICALRLAAAVNRADGAVERGSAEAVVFHHNPAIDIGLYEGRLTCQCTICQTLLGPAQENWKLCVPLVEQRIEENYLREHSLRIGLRRDPAMLSRQYLCPGCGHALEVELAVEGDPIIHDSRPAHYEQPLQHSAH